jgi:TRAP-type mannitol/chloroaromatic compound transport system substrate-binding protein
MNRRKFLASAAAGTAVASTLAAPALAQAYPEIKWRMASSYPKSLDTIYGGGEFLVRRVAELTDNKFQIQSFGAGEIVPGLQTMQAVRDGTIEMTCTAPYYYIGVDPAFAFGSVMPFGLNTRMQHAWMWQGGGNELLNEFYAKHNAYCLPAGNTGCQMGGWFRKEIKTVEDVKGVKIRIGGYAGRVFQRLGGVPQQIAGGDIYPALEKGTIDAAEWVGPYDDEKLGFNKVAPFYYYPGWWEGNSMVGAMMNIEKWKSLPKLYQDAMTAACAETCNWMMARYDVLNPAALRRLVASGTQLRPFPPAVLDAFFKATNEVNNEIAATNEWFKKLLDHHNNFRSESYLWWQVAEYSMDTYNIRTRAQQKG